MARIAVIGAGAGALAAAARLAVAGHRVAVYERTETYGGALRRRERDGFAFDTGPGLLPLPAVYRDLFVKTGREPLEECVELVQADPSSHHVFADGTRVSLPNASRAGVVSAVEEALGADAARRWGDFLVRAREAWDRARRPLLEEPLWPNWEVLAEREPYPAVPAPAAAAAAQGGHAGGGRCVGAARSAAAGAAGEPRPGVRPGPADHPGERGGAAVHGARLRHLVRARRAAGAGAGDVRAVPGPPGGVPLRRGGHRGAGRRTAGRRAWNSPTARRRRRTWWSPGSAPACWSGCAARGCARRARCPPGGGGEPDHGAAGAARRPPGGHPAPDGGAHPGP